MGSVSGCVGGLCVEDFDGFVVVFVGNDYFDGYQVGVGYTGYYGHVLVEDEGLDAVFFKDAFADVGGESVVEFLDYFHDVVF